MKTLTIYPESRGTYVCDDLSAPGTPVVGRGHSPDKALRDYLAKSGIKVVVETTNPREINSAVRGRGGDLTVRG